MRNPGVQASARGIVRCVSLGMVFLTAAAHAGELQAQNVISVPFTNGFIGTRGSSAGTSNNVLTYTTLGIVRTFFIQNSSTNTFELQGNDIPGTLRIVRTDGTALDIPASANWRNSGGTTYLIGILPRPAAPITFAYAGGSIQITNGSVSGGSSIGGYVAAYSGSMLADGASTSGNAAQSQVLGGLNSYLTTVVDSRPAGPVTVNALTTSSTTPTITGTVSLAAGENLSVVVNGIQFTSSSSPALSLGAGEWSLTLTSPLIAGTYSVTATITNADGFTLSDPTVDELVVAVGGGVTIAGSFTANDKTYDRGTAATGNTGGLTLVGVNVPDDVTIVAVSLAFQTASVGTEKTVVVTGVTLGGADAGDYVVSLTGAPTASADITAQPLTIDGSFTAANKAYDGTTAATIVVNSLSLVGVLNGDDVALTGVTAAFADAAVGAGKPVTLSSANLSGAAAGNYTLSLNCAPTTTANIVSAGAMLTIAGSFTADDKTYDGTTAATGNTGGLTLVGVNVPDEVTIVAASLAFQTAAAGTEKTVVITGVTLGGAHAGDYAVSLTGAPAATTAIVPKALAIDGSFTAANKPYDGTTAATIVVNSLSLVGVLDGDDVALTDVTATFADAAVGTAKEVTMSSAILSGAAADNYTLNLNTAPTTTADIYTAAAPSTPRDVVAVPGDGRLTVKWVVPENAGCAAISGYIVEYSADDGKSWTRMAVLPPSPTSASIAGLVNNVWYRVRVAAVNPCGTGPFSASVTAVPIGPTRNDQGQPSTSAPGTAHITTGGGRKPAVIEVVQDTIARVATGDFALRIRTSDQAGSAIPIDSSRTLLLEQGGSATADGSGFAARTFVTIYLINALGEPLFLGTVKVGPDGTFAITARVPDNLPPGSYTLQVNGIDLTTFTPRSVALGVQVVLPAADLVLTATSDELSPTVGDTITITLIVTNRGQGPAIDVVIPRAFTEAGFTIVRATPLDGSYHAGTHEWKIARIEVGARARLLLVVVVVPPTVTEGLNR
jgi:hypothetical protein